MKKTLDRPLPFCHVTPMTDDPTEAGIHRYIEELSRKGIKLSQTQVWVLVKTYDRHYTIKQLADLRNMSHNGMYLAVRELETMRLLDKTHTVGREWYYICRFDISETADFSPKIKYKKQTMSIETLIGYLENAANLQRIPHYMAASLCFLFNRSVKKDAEKQVLGPTPSEVRSFLMSLSVELEEFSVMLRQLIDMNLYDPITKLHELIGEMNDHRNTREIIDYYDGEFISRWEAKGIGIKGLQAAAKPKEYSEDFYKDWTP